MRACLEAYCLFWGCQLSWLPTTLAFPATETAHLVMQCASADCTTPSRSAAGTPRTSCMGPGLENPCLLFSRTFRLAQWMAAIEFDARDSTSPRRQYSIAADAAVAL